MWKAPFIMPEETRALAGFSGRVGRDDPGSQGVAAEDS